VRQVTVVYEIVDEVEWSKRNPLHYAHDGLKAVRVAIGDAINDRITLAEQVIKVLEGIGSEDELERMAEDVLHGRTVSPMGQTVIPETTTAGQSYPASAGSESRKAMWWQCECGKFNAAPALQNPTTPCVCDKCGTITSWKNVLKKQ
jgi:hypothetical protein